MTREGAARTACGQALLVSERGVPFSHQEARRLAEGIGVEVARMPGTHTPYADQPAELARRIRSFAREPAC